MLVNEPPRGHFILFIMHYVQISTLTSTYYPSNAYGWRKDGSLSLLPVSVIRMKACTQRSRFSGAAHRHRR